MNRRPDEPIVDRARLGHGLLGQGGEIGGVEVLLGLVDEEVRRYSLVAVCSNLASPSERSSDASVKIFREDFGVDQLNNAKRLSRCAKGISCP